MAIESDLYTRVTAQLATILSGDVRLSRDLPSTVQVEVGPFREIPGPDAIVFVYRSRVGADWWMGQQGVDVDATWNVEAVTRVMGDPAELEERCSIIAANILAVLSDHNNEAGYWVMQKLGPSVPLVARKGGEHIYEIERLAVPMKLNGVDL